MHRLKLIFVRLGIERAVHVVARRIGPQRQRPPDGGVRLAHDPVGMLVDVGEEPRPGPQAMNQLGEHPGHFARGIAHERAIVRIVERRRQRPPEAFFKSRLALVALARPHRIAAVIGGRVAEHVEEQPIDLVALERLGENLDPMLAVIRRR